MLSFTVGCNQDVIHVYKQIHGPALEVLHPLHVEKYALHFVVKKAPDRNEIIRTAL
jgi:hypothetical protein